MKQIYLLTDYRGRFGSKCKEASFRSGFDLEVLHEEFYKRGYDLSILKFSDVSLKKNWRDEIIIYSFYEDFGGRYKNYIEDVVYGLEQSGAIVIPKFSMLRAHNNKVFMEIMRDLYFPDDRIKSLVFGNLEELKNISQNLKYPVVIKSYEGAVSRNVRMCYSEKELISSAKKIMRTTDPIYELKEFYRSKKLPPYKPDSKYRKKAIVQNMIEGLGNDWKVLVFGEKIYKLKRFNRKNDPRASGSGLFEYDRDIDKEVLDFAVYCYNKFDVPVASLDIAKDDDGCVLIEFQFVTFGPRTLEYSDHYYMKKDGIWNIVDESSDLEVEFARSYSDYIDTHIISK